ncbi:MAG: hypothetical protein IKV39_04815, partial [Clostridia bacterium]|nr:hypothetical protein [Clostridia bacterium]
ETDEKIHEGENERPETDVPENGEETQTQPGENTPGENTPETNAPDTTKPETSYPETKAPETEPAEITPPDTTPEETTPPETEAPYYPDYAPAPDHIRYVMVDSKIFRDFVTVPNIDITDNGYNYYTMLDDGTFYMRQITNSGFERYVGEYRGGEMDLSLDVIAYVLSGDMQEMLIENKVNDTILNMCAVTRGDSYPKLTAVWIETKSGDYFITYDSNADESAFTLYTRKEYMELID